MGREPISVLGSPGLSMTLVARTPCALPHLTGRGVQWWRLGRVERTPVRETEYADPESESARTWSGAQLETEGRIGEVSPEVGEGAKQQSLCFPSSPLLPGSSSEAHWALATSSKLRRFLLRSKGLSDVAAAAATQDSAPSP